MADAASDARSGAGSSAGSGVAASLQVEVAYALAPREVWLRSVALGPGATALDALVSAGLFAAFPDLAGTALHVSRWGCRCRPDDALRDGDRIEVCRPLRVDPKKARRERFEAQGARSAGLFARKRPGAKAGY